MLKLSPFIAIATSTSPEEMVITVGTNDWDQIYGALKGLNKIEACKIFEAIISWHDIDNNEYSSQDTSKFFEDIKNKADKNC
jgi:hypothetical protein